jgi:hypothetical protein
MLAISNGSFAVGSAGLLSAGAVDVWEGTWAGAFALSNVLVCAEDGSNNIGGVREVDVRCCDFCSGSSFGAL